MKIKVLALQGAFAEHVSTLRAIGVQAVELMLEPAAVAEVLERTGITFVFASAFHPGFRHAGPTRAELGVPTVFNFLGPLCNPARARPTPSASRSSTACRSSLACSAPAAPRPWSSAGTMDWTSSRPPGTAGCGRSAAATSTSTTSTRGISASRSPDIDELLGGSPRTTPRSSAARRRRRWRGARHRAAERRGRDRRLRALPRCRRRCSARSSSGSPRRSDDCGRSDRQRRRCPEARRLGRSATRDLAD